MARQATLGIDLASQAKKTGLAIIEWEDGRAELTTLVKGGGVDGSLALNDKTLAFAMRGLAAYPGGPPTKIAIDAPFGWPEPFVEALVAHQHGDGWPSTIDEPRGLYERRETDRYVRAETGKLPLSVSTDRIAYCAMRCATLLRALAHMEGPDSVARDGSGLAAEVYPDPALRKWLPALYNGARQYSYKGTSEAAYRRREVLVSGLIAATEGRFRISAADRALCVETDDALDAVVCAMLARAIELGLTQLPATPEVAELARAEGWIHLPSSPVVELFR